MSNFLLGLLLGFICAYYLFFKCSDRVVTLSVIEVLKKIAESQQNEQSQTGYIARSRFSRPYALTFYKTNDNS